MSSDQSPAFRPASSPKKGVYHGTAPLANTTMLCLKDIAGLSAGVDVSFSALVVQVKDLQCTAADGSKFPMKVVSVSDATCLDILFAFV
jgi:hypothetical protein